jgi:hypothetical protein
MVTLYDPTNFVCVLHFHRLGSTNCQFVGYEHPHLMIQLQS